MIFIPKNKKNFKYNTDKGNKICHIWQTMNKPTDKWHLQEVNKRHIVEEDILATLIDKWKPTNKGQTNTQKKEYTKVPWCCISIYHNSSTKIMQKHIIWARHGAWVQQKQLILEECTLEMELRGVSALIEHEWRLFARLDVTFTKLGFWFLL